MLRRGTLVGSLVLLAALPLAACGGGGSGDEGAIVGVIETVATTKDPGNCTKRETLRFAEQNNARQGKAAVEACEQAAEAGRARAKSATVSNVSVNGSKATAEATLQGGSLDSQTVEFALVEEGGTWKVDRVEGFAHYDGKALGQAFKEEFEVEPQGLTAAQGDCIAREIGKASKTRAEELFFSGSSKPIVELAKGCA